jgi:hypothetical protein
VAETSIELNNLGRSKRMDLVERIARGLVEDSGIGTVKTTNGGVKRNKKNLLEEAYRFSYGMFVMRYLKMLTYYYDCLVVI